MTACRFMRGNVRVHRHRHITFILGGGVSSSKFVATERRWGREHEISIKSFPGWNGAVDGLGCRCLCDDIAADISHEVD